MVVGEAGGGGGGGEGGRGLRKRGHPQHPLIPLHHPGKPIRAICRARPSIAGLVFPPDLALICGPRGAIDY